MSKTVQEVCCLGHKLVYEEYCLSKGEFLFLILSAFDATLFVTHTRGAVSWVMLFCFNRFRCLGIHVLRAEEGLRTWQQLSGLPNRRSDVLPLDEANMSLTLDVDSCE